MKQALTHFAFFLLSMAVFIGAPIITYASFNPNWIVGTVANYKLEAAKINSGCTAVTTETGDWINTATSSGTGNCTLTLQSSTFSANPYCMVLPASTTALAGEVAFGASTISTATVAWFMSQPGTGAVNRVAWVICFGAR